MSDLRVSSIVSRKVGTSPKAPDGVIVSGIATATTFDGNLTGTATTATSAINAKSGSALETSINSKTSPGKAIALSMVFG